MPAVHESIIGILQLELFSRLSTDQALRALAATQLTRISLYNIAIAEDGVEQLPILTIPLKDIC